MLHDQAENQFTLTTSIASIDQGADIFALDQAGQQLKPVFGLDDWPQRKLLRYHRQIGKRPLTALDLVLLGRGNFEQMADRRRQHILLALEVIALARKAAQRPRDIGSNGRLFSND